MSLVVLVSGSCELSLSCQADVSSLSLVGRAGDGVRLWALASCSGSLVRPGGNHDRFGVCEENPVNLWGYGALTRTRVWLMSVPTV